MDTVFEALQQTIVYNDAENFRELLAVIPFDKLDMSLFKNIVFTILNMFEATVQSFNPELRIESIESVLQITIPEHIPNFLREFIELLVENSPDNENFHPIVVILRDNRSNNLTTKLLYEAKYYGASNIRLLIRQDNDTNCFRAVLRQCKISKLDTRTAEELITIAEGNDEANNGPNNEAINALNEYIRTIKKRATKPEWVTSKYDDKTEDELLDMLGDTEEYVIEYKRDITNEELAVALTAGFEVFNPPVEQMESLRESILERVEAMTADERNTYIESFLDNVSRQPMVFIEKFNRILGPANTPNVSVVDNGGEFIVDVKTIVYDTDGSWCSETGGHRMLYCNHYEIDEDTNHESGFDWYLGADQSCMQCGKYIPVREWAVRYPLNNGGWYGCFCSWEHVLESKPIDNGYVYPMKPDDCDDAGCDAKSANQQVQNIAVARMAQMVQQYGIESRRKERKTYPSFSIAGLTLVTRDD